MFSPLADVVCSLLGEDSFLQDVVERMDGAQLQSLFLMEDLQPTHPPSFTTSPRGQTSAQPAKQANKHETDL